MFSIILLSHGSLSKAMLETVQLIAGEQENIEALGFDLGDDIERFREQVTYRIDRCLQRGELLVFTDLQSGSPFNVTVGAMCSYDFRHFSGMNLPIILEALCDRQSMDLEQTCDDIKMIAANSIMDVNEYLNVLDSETDCEE